MLLGYTGLDLFFVLSGFLITGVLLDARETPNRVRNFYVRRGLRVLPLYYGVVFALVVLWPLFRPDGTPAIDTLRHNQWWYWFHATNFISRLPGAMPYNTGHFWSLAVEEQFYLIWPWLVFTLSPKTLLRLCLVCIVERSLPDRGHREWFGGLGGVLCMDADGYVGGGRGVAILLRYPPSGPGWRRIAGRLQRWGLGLVGWRPFRFSPRCGGRGSCHYTTRWDLAQWRSPSWPSSRRHRRDGLILSSRTVYFAFLGSTATGCRLSFAAHAQVRTRCMRSWIGCRLWQGPVCYARSCSLGSRRRVLRCWAS